MGPDRLTDSLGRTWQAGSALARGTWGRSRLVRDASGREAVLKVPLGREDFPADANVSDELVRACAAVAREQAELMQEAVVQPGAAAVQPPRLEATVDLGDGRTGLVLPRYTTLARRLEAGLPLAEALRLVHRVASALAENHRVHGNLKPTNVLFGERGEIHLADPCTPALAAHLAELATYADATGFLPPERRAGGAPVKGSDTWALCRVLWAALGELEPVAGGVDKLEVATAKDRAHARLGTEGSNPRFRGRVADRLGALLSRGLSRDAEPSPPYRFATARELADRVAEVLALVRPKVVDVGRLLPPSTAPEGVFVGEGPVTFSVTVGCTPGLTDPEDLVCGVQLADLDAPGEPRVPVEDAGLDVQAHPSGRLRYALSLDGIRPGRYRLRVAFAVKDSGDEPQVVTGELQVRPPPGYVPPPVEPAAPAPIPFDARRARPSAEPTGDRPSDPGEEPLTDPGEEVRRPAPTPAARPTRPPTHPPADAAPVRPARPDPASSPDAAEERTFPRPVPPPEEPDPEPPPPARPSPRPAQGGPSPSPFPGLRPVPAPPEDEGLDTEELLADTQDAPRSTGSSPAVAPAERPPAPAPPPPMLYSGDGPSDAGIPSFPGLGSDAQWAPPPSGGSGGLEDDLPDEGLGSESGGRTRSLPPALAAALEILRRDRYLSVGVAVATSLFLILLLTLLVKAC